MKLTLFRVTAYGKHGTYSHTISAERAQDALRKGKRALAPTLRAAAYRKPVRWTVEVA